MAKLETGPYKLAYKYHILTNRRFGFIIFGDGKLSRPFLAKPKPRKLSVKQSIWNAFPRLNGVRLLKVLSRTFQANKLPRHETTADWYPYQPLTCKT